MEFSAIASGSSGNCIYVRSGGTSILIDAGLAGKRICANLHELECDPAGIQGILVTHEHRDHVCGVGVMARKFEIPVFANEATWEGMKPIVGKIPDFQQKTVVSGMSTEIGDLRVSSFRTSHDSAESIGYVIDDGKTKFALATDTGVLTSAMLAILKDVDCLLLESNHDLNMLQNGRYPWSLKKRILGEYGHLSNKEASAAVEFLVRYGRVGAGRVLLGHLSQENNLPELVLKEVHTQLNAGGIVPGKDVQLDLALRDRRTPLYTAG